MALIRRIPIAIARVPTAAAQIPIPKASQKSVDHAIAVRVQRAAAAVTRRTTRSGTGDGVEVVRQIATITGAMIEAKKNRMGTHQNLQKLPATTRIGMQKMKQNRLKRLATTRIVMQKMARRTTVMGRNVATESATTIGGVGAQTTGIGSVAMTEIGTVVAVAPTGEAMIDGMIEIVAGVMTDVTTETETIDDAMRDMMMIATEEDGGVQTVEIVVMNASARGEAGNTERDMSR